VAPESAWNAANRFYDLLWDQSSIYRQKCEKSLFFIFSKELDGAGAIVDALLTLPEKHSFSPVEAHCPERSERRGNEISPPAPVARSQNADAGESPERRLIVPSLLRTSVQQTLLFTWTLKYTAGLSCRLGFHAVLRYQIYFGVEKQALMR